MTTYQPQGMAMLPWFHRDFLASTQGWTLPETGAYFLLLGAQWELGSLPPEMSALATIARLSIRQFKTIWHAKLSHKFQQRSDGYVNVRLEQHRAKAQSLREKHRNGASQTNLKRWGAAYDVTSATRSTGGVVSVAQVAQRLGERQAALSHGDSQSDSHGEPQSESLSVSPPSPSPSPSPSQEKLQESTATRKRARPAVLKGERARPDVIDESDPAIRRARLHAAALAGPEKSRKASRREEDKPADTVPVPSNNGTGRC